jgi:hypothetical protein
MFRPAFEDLSLMMCAGGSCSMAVLTFVGMFVGILGDGILGDSSLWSTQADKGASEVYGVSAKSA